MNLVWTMFGDNVILMTPSNRGKHDNTIDYFNLAGTGIFCGIGGFAYEACGTIFTVKETMKNPRKMGVLLATTFTFIGMMFLTISLSFYLVYGNEELDPCAFKIYTSARPFMHSLSIAFSIVITLFLPLYNISNSELLEEFDWVLDFVSLHSSAEVASQEDRDKSRPRLFLFRAALFIVTIAFAFLTNKVEVVLNFSGAVIIPFICFYIPIVANLMTAKYLKQKLSIWRLLHEYALLIIAAAVQGFGIYYSIWCQILGKC